MKLSVLLLIVFAAWSQVAQAIDVAQSVLTQHNDNARTGAQVAEHVLQPSNVTPPLFGWLYTLVVSGEISAQPLFVKALDVDGQIKDVLFVATRENQLYAFDVSAVDGKPTPTAQDRVWTLHLLDPDGRDAAPIPAKNCGQLQGHVGITSTPVIDPVDGTLYVVFRTGVLESQKADGAAKHWLAAVDIRTGKLKQTSAGNDAIVEVTAPDFHPEMQLNRASLLLLNGVIYVGFGAAICDDGGDPNKGPNEKVPPHGWVLAYDTKLQPLASFNTTPQTAHGGIWQSGSGLAGNARGDVFAFTGNHGVAAYATMDHGAVISNAVNNTTDQCFSHWGNSDWAAVCKPGIPNPPLKDPNTSEFGQSILRLHLNGLDGANHQFTVARHRVGNWFRLDTGERWPTDQDAYYDGQDGTLKQLNDGKPKHVAGDTDLGSGGPTLLPNGWLVGGGKQGRIYLVDPADMTIKASTSFYHTWNPEVSPCDYDKSQEYGPNIHGSLAAWRPSNSSYTLVYGMPEKEYLKAYRAFDNGALDQHPFLSTTEIGIRSPRGMPGAAVSLSANGGRDGIVWVSVAKQDSPDAQNTSGDVNGRLMAFDANTLDLLWEAKDEVDGVAFAKFVPPTVANGNLFRVAYKNKVLVYGPKNTGDAPIAKQPTVAVRPITAVWRNPDHLDLFMASRVNSQNNVLSTNWEAVCTPSPNTPTIQRGWRGLFPVAAWVKEDFSELPPGFGATVAAGQSVTAVVGDPAHKDRVNLFVVDAQGHVLSNFWGPFTDCGLSRGKWNWLTKSGWCTWFAIGPETGTTRPGAEVSATWNVGESKHHLDLFMTNLAGVVESTFFETDHWRPEGWFPISPDSVKAAPGSPVAAVWRDRDHLDLFVTSNQGVVMHTFWEFSGGWHPWQPVHPASAHLASGQPITALWSNPNHLDLFIVDDQGRVKTIFQEARVWRSEGWFQVGQSTTRAKASQRVTALWRNSDHLDLFMTNTDGTVERTFWEFVGGWRNWVAVSADGTTAATGQPVAAVWNDAKTHLDLFITDINGRVLSIFSQNDLWRPEGWFLVQ